MIFKTFITSIFIVIIFHLTIINTRYLWDKPKIHHYDKSYKEILNIIKPDTIKPDTIKPDTIKPDTINSEIKNMKTELKNYVENLT